MSQPITLTLAQRAPRPLRWLGIPAGAGAAEYAIPGAAAGLASAGGAELAADAERQKSSATPLWRWRWIWSGAMRACCRWGTGSSLPSAGTPWGMYLMRQAAGDGLPAFMSFLSWSELPLVLVGHAAFRLGDGAGGAGSRSAGPGFRLVCLSLEDQRGLFSIMTQALTYAGMLLFFRNETGFGGNNGFTGFTTLLGFPVTATGTRATLFMATVLLLLLTLWLGSALAQSKFGRILTAVRDAENRLMFCGYDPRGFKLLVWTLSAVLCGLAGALYVPQVGIINPSGNVADQLHRGRHLGRARRARHPDRPGAWRRAGQRREKHFHRGDARVLAAVSWASSSSS